MRASGYFFGLCLLPALVLGAGEAGQGSAAAALGNAIADATGRRLRDLPLSRERIGAALGTVTVRKIRF